MNKSKKIKITNGDNNETTHFKRTIPTEVYIEICMFFIGDTKTFFSLIQCEKSSYKMTESTIKINPFVLNSHWKKLLENVQIIDISAFFELRYTHNSFSKSIEINDHWCTNISLPKKMTHFKFEKLIKKKNSKKDYYFINLVGCTRFGSKNIKPLSDRLIKIDAYGLTQKSIDKLKNVCDEKVIIDTTVSPIIEEGSKYTYIMYSLDAFQKKKFDDLFKV